MKIAIVGLAIPHPTGKELKKKGYTVWTLGRNADPDCDRYYELHGLQTKHPEKLVRRNLHSVVYGMCDKEGLPLNCSACGMALETLLEQDVEEVLITGCPQDSPGRIYKRAPRPCNDCRLFKRAGKENNLGKFTKKPELWKTKMTITYEGKKK